MKRILAALLIVLCLTASFAFAEERQKYKSWYSFGTGNLLPDPSDVFGRDVSFPEAETMNNDIGFIGEVKDVTLEDFQKYTEACVSFGFEIEELYTEFLLAYDKNHKPLMVEVFEDGRMLVTYG